MQQLPGLTTSALAVAAMLATGCGDAPLEPTSENVVPLAVSAEERELMRTSLLFAQEQWSLVSTRSEGSGVVAAFLVLTQRLEQNDRVAVERGIGDARAAIRRYRDIAGAGNTADPDLEAISLTLDQVAALATGSPSSQEPQP